VNAKSKKIERQREIDLVLTKMFAYYQTEVYDAGVLDLYHQALEGYRIEEIRTACTTHIKTSKWFPKISEILDLMPNQHVAQIESTARAQAAMVLQMIRTMGSRFGPYWADPITDALMNSRWKWTSLCETSTSENEVWFIKEFIVSYVALADQQQAGVGMLGAPEKLKQLAVGLFKGVKNNPHVFDDLKAALAEVKG